MNICAACVYPHHGVVWFPWSSEEAWDLLELEFMIMSYAVGSGN